MGKHHKWLICIDSDGCAMDTMTIKHLKCFGPCLINEWQLEQWREPLLNRWNEINLYEETRGINRFKGLVRLLEEVNDRYQRIDGLMELRDWVEHTDELSENSLKNSIEEKNIPVMRKALHWSQMVNQEIAALDENLKQPFPGVKEALRETSEKADVVIVSSANRQAVLEEWDRCGLMDYVTDVMAQDNGSKAQCIGTLLKQGYEKDNVLMVGDAMGDLAAAKKNEVYFFPILVKNEKTSWEEFRMTVLDQFEMGLYKKKVQEKQIERFRSNFGGKEFSKTENGRR